MNQTPSAVDARGSAERRDWDVPLYVDVRSYLLFSRRIDSQLRRLTARWERENRNDRRERVEPP